MLLVLMVACGARAQAAAPKLEPLPEPRPPPPMPGPEDPGVRIPVQENATVEEVHRIGGRVVAVKVTPPGGKPYFLIDVEGSGDWMRRDALDSLLRVPLWLIHEFD